MLGVIIGVASVVALVGVGQGTTSNITSRLAGLGTNLLTISPTGGGGVDRDADRSTTRRDRRRSPAIGGVAPEISTTRPSRSGTDQHDHDRSSARPRPTRPSAPTTSGRARFLTDASRRPATCGSPSSARRRRRTSGSAPATSGPQISIGGLPFQVIGILQPKGGTGLPGSRRPGPRPDRRRPEVLRRRRHGPDDRRLASPTPTR